jgi:hypothetical protein
MMMIIIMTMIMIMMIMPMALRMISTCTGELDWWSPFQYTAWRWHFDVEYIRAAYLSWIVFMMRILLYFIENICSLIYWTVS